LCFTRPFSCYILTECPPSVESRSTKEVSYKEAGAGLASATVRFPNSATLALLPIEDAKSKLRTHRQRTQGYIRELEKEVLRLRDKEEAYLKKNETLDEKVRTLEQHILASNILFPEGYNVSTTKFDQGLSSAPSLSALESDDLRAKSQTPGLINSDSETGWSSHSIVGTDATPSSIVNVDLTGLSTLDPFRFEDFDADEDIPPQYLPPQALEAGRVCIPQLPGTRQTLNSQDGVDFILM
jgi:hypothetical protein